jgi:hypothetical protein
MSTRRRRNSVLPDKRRWENADEGDVHKVVFGYVERVERDQFELFNRFVLLESLYDPNTPDPNGDVAMMEASEIGLVIENVIASNVDTVTAQIATTEVRPRFQTDDGDWSVMRTATKLEYYAEGVGKLLDIHAPCRRAFKEAAKKGTGVVKVYVNAFDQIKVEHVRIDDIVVDEAECKNGGVPRQLHQRMTNVDREELKAMFPEHEKEIDTAQASWAGRNWAGYRPIADSSIVAIESWKLPIGPKGHKHYVPGRHTITIENCDLLDEEYHDEEFPFACIVWSERTTSFYGISLAERIAGIQRALNKRNWQIDRNLDQYAVPTTYVGQADANLAVQSINRIGTVVVYRDKKPETVTPLANSPEVYQNRAEMKASASEESGVSRMASQAVKPAGIDSGVGMREYRDQTTVRFAPQEADFQALELNVFRRVIACCKSLGNNAPVISHKTKFGVERMKWSDVDLRDVKIQIAAASTLSRTPAGRYQTALEWAQAGVISTDEWRRLTKHPDLDHILSLYTQGMESVERDIEAIRDGAVVVPEPFGNLQLMVRMGQMAYLRDRDIENVPESVLEGLRQYAVLAAHMVGSVPANGSIAAGAGAAPPPPGSDIAPAPGLPPGGVPMPAQGMLPASVAPAAMAM